MTGPADMPAADDLIRCGWATGSVIETEYHDTVWGLPEHDPRRLFEFLTLEGAQAGLSWRTILQKRQGYTDVFDDFDVVQIAAYTDADVGRCLADARIVRNRAKVESTIGNARAWLELDDPASYLWAFVEGTPIQSNRRDVHDLQATSTVSDRMSKDLRTRGFSFVGSTICYSLMQACGLVNDHLVSCFRHRQCVDLNHLRPS